MNVRLPLITVAVVNVAAASLVAVQLWNGSQRDQLAGAESMQIPVAGAVHELPAATIFDAVQAQAVFHKSRSFYVAPQAPVVQQPAPDYRYAGSMSIPNRPASAVLTHNQTSARMKVAVGDQLEGWTVADVRPGKVVVQLGDRMAEITATARGQAGGTASGITMTSGMQLMNIQSAAPAPSAGMVRVLGTPGASPGIAPRANAASNEAPRLYRPPVRQ